MFWHGRATLRDLVPETAITYRSFLFTNECTSNCLENNIKIYIKIAPTCFGVVTPSSGSSFIHAC